MVAALAYHGIDESVLEAYNGLDYDESIILNGREIRIFVRE